ncbi:hypothetical protein Q4575_17035 [Psychrosphaera sp. 1_MG-2023]|uniref:hypothetical protein n=1 Tax=Psychrosphaera sp. 1_MG-2023 TaxID=3062643 RepID=UPI0026E44449|nr:hypothetical protein [Psychrosphaera sp. 1_MG-2023]MDO6721118.1 hypothetical protein [Psychrosphaera sp. 1_MG-2023]
MTTITQTYNDTIPTSRSLVWFKQGWQLMKQAPFKLFLFLFSFLIIEGVIQMLPAPYSVVVSKWAMALMAASTWPLLQHLAKHQRFSLKAIFCSGWGKMLGLAIVLILPSVMQLWTANALLGADGLALLIYGTMVEVTQLQLGIIFASATPVMLFLSFASARVLLADDSISAAIRASVQAVIRAWRPMLVIMMVNAVLLLLVPFTFVLSALLTGPWLACVTYQAYCELFDNDSNTTQIIKEM